MEMELSAQRATLSEQRQHIDVLDTALSNAQANVVKLQEEVSLSLNIGSHNFVSVSEHRS